MVSLETFRALASVYAAFSLIGTLGSLVAACYNIYTFDRQPSHQVYLYTLSDGSTNLEMKQYFPDPVEQTDGLRYGNALSLFVWCIMNLVFDEILIKGIKQMNSLYVQIHRIYFIITYLLYSIALVWLGCAVLGGGSQQITNVYLIVLCLVHVMFTCIYWILTGLVRGIREQEQRGRTAGAEMSQPNLTIANNCDSLGLMKKPDNEFDA